MKIKQAEFWGLKAYQFKLYMFLKYVDSKINVLNEKEIKSIAAFIRVPHDLIIEGLNELEKDGFIDILPFGIGIKEVEFYGE